MSEGGSGDSVMMARAVRNHLFSDFRICNIGFVVFKVLVLSIQLLKFSEL